MTTFPVIFTKFLTHFNAKHMPSILGIYNAYFFSIPSSSLGFFPILFITQIDPATNPDIYVWNGLHCANACSNRGEGKGAKWVSLTKKIDGLDWTGKTLLLWALLCFWTAIIWGRHVMSLCSPRARQAGRMYWSVGAYKKSFCSCCSWYCSCLFLMFCWPITKMSDEWRLTDWIMNRIPCQREKAWVVENFDEKLLFKFIFL